MTRYRIALLFSVFALFFMLPNFSAAQDNEAQSVNYRILLEDADGEGDAEAAPDADQDGEEGAEAAPDDVASISDDEFFEPAERMGDDPTQIGDGTRESAVKGHGLQASMSFNGVPGAIIDHWFASHGNTWDGVASMGFSLDYFLRFAAPCELRISLSWVNGRTGDAYWLQKDYADTPALADYVHNDLSMVNLEVAAYHVIDMAEWAAFYYGGGIWGGVIVGDAKSYAIRSSCATAADDWKSCTHEPGSVPVTGVPPVFGFVSVTLGFKFTFLEIMTARAEAGFKGYFYGQVGLGVEF